MPAQPRPRAAAPRRPGTALLVALLALILAACGTASAPSAAPADGEPASRGVGDQAADAGGGSAEEGAGAGDPGAAPGSGHDPGGEPLAQLAERRVVKTGEVTLEVASVGEALGRVRAVAIELGGYVGGSQAGTPDDSATLTLRVPAERFDDALAALHDLDGEVVSEATREQDVSGQLVDLGARIDNLRASEASYRALLERATRIEDILNVQARLDAVRGEIEQLSAQLEQLEGQADLATLTVTLVPQAQPVERQTQTWNPATTLSEALASLVGVGQGLLDALIWFVVVWLPLLLVLTIAALVVLRGVLEVRRRMPVARGGEGRPAA